MPFTSKPTARISASRFWREGLFPPGIAHSCRITWKSNGRQPSCGCTARASVVHVIEIPDEGYQNFKNAC
jgi:hypothetical protein